MSGLPVNIKALPILELGQLFISEIFTK